MAGDQVWVTKGSYQAIPSIGTEMNVVWSNFRIMGGFDDKQPATDTSQRDLSYGATSIGTRIYIGKTDGNVKSVTIDGFTVFDNKTQYIGVKSNAGDESIEIKNFKARNILTDDGVLVLPSKYNVLENCEFESNNWASGVGVTLGGESKMLNCTFIENGGSGYYAPIDFLSPLTVRGGVYKGNYRYDDEGKKAVSHFDISSGQVLIIDFAKIQGGESGIFRGTPPGGTLFYGTSNITTE
jgi:hypothetical protein